MDQKRSDPPPEHGMSTSCCGHQANVWLLSCRPCWWSLSRPLGSAGARITLVQWDHGCNFFSCSADGHQSRRSRGACFVVFLLHPPPAPCRTSPGLFCSARFSSSSAAMVRSSRLAQHRDNPTQLDAFVSGCTGVNLQFTRSTAEINNPGRGWYSQLEMSVLSGQYPLTLTGTTPHDSYSLVLISLLSTCW